MDVAKVILFTVILAFLFGALFYVDPFLEEHPRFSIDDTDTRSTVSNFFKLGILISMLFSIFMMFDGAMS